MAKYTLSQSKAVPAEREVGAFTLQVEFEEGPLSGRRFLAGGLNDLWALVGFVASMEQEFFFQVTHQGNSLVLLGCFRGQSFCLFQHISETRIGLLNSPEIDFDNLDLVRVVDRRWPLVFFLPRSAFFSFDTLVEVGNEVIRSGTATSLTEFPQTYSALGLSPVDTDHRF